MTGQNAAHSQRDNLYRNNWLSWVVAGSMLRSSTPKTLSNWSASMKKTNGAAIHQPPWMAAAATSGKMSRGTKCGSAFETDGLTTRPVMDTEALELRASIPETLYQGDTLHGPTQSKLNVPATGQATCRRTRS